MDKLDTLLYNALRRYENILSYTGYIKDIEVNRLLLLMFMSDFATEFEDVMDESDISNIDRILEEMLGCSCLITCSYDDDTDTTVSSSSTSTIRITNADHLRKTNI